MSRRAGSASRSSSSSSRASTKLSSSSRKRRASSSSSSSSGRPGKVARGVHDNGSNKNNYSNNDNRASSAPRATTAPDGHSYHFATQVFPLLKKFMDYHAVHYSYRGVDIGTEDQVRRWLCAHGLPDDVIHGRSPHSHKTPQSTTTTTLTADEQAILLHWASVAFTKQSDLLQVAGKKTKFTQKEIIHLLGKVGLHQQADGSFHYATTGRLPGFASLAHVQAGLRTQGNAIFPRAAYVNNLNETEQAKLGLWAATQGMPAAVPVPVGPTLTPPPPGQGPGRRGRASPRSRTSRKRTTAKIPTTTFTTSTTNSSHVTARVEKQRHAVNTTPTPQSTPRTTDSTPLSSSGKEPSSLVALKPSWAFHLSFALLAFVCLTYQLVCPYTKVEESFPLQAMHDLYYHGVTPALWPNHPSSTAASSGGAESPSVTLPYDHLQYPGVVPRSFVAPFLVSTVCRVVACLVSPLVHLDDYPLCVQGLARFTLLLGYLHGWYRLATALQRRCAPAGTYALLWTASQFHLTFYASRPLPNTMALILCLHAWAAWFRGDSHGGGAATAAVYLIVTTAVLRCDVLLLLFTCGLVWLGTGELRLGQAIWLGIQTGIVTLALTVPLDSVLWQKWIWPEGIVFYYNAILGQSENWGTSPWHWYLTSALPKALLGSVVWLPWSLLKPSRSSSGLRSLQVDRVWVPPFLSLAGFVAIYSCLGHKEVRFLFPALPLANALAAVGWAKCFRWAFPVKEEDVMERSPMWWKRAVWAVGWLVWLANGTASVMFVAVSRQNYPGGLALELLKATNPAVPCRVYIDNAAAMTGVSLFGQRNLPQCTFIKAGYEEHHQDLFSASGDIITHMITEDSALGGNDFATIQFVPGHPRLNWKHASIETSDALFVRERTQETPLALAEDAEVPYSVAPEEAMVGEYGEAEVNVPREEDTLNEVGDKEEKDNVKEVGAGEEEKSNEAR